MTNDAAERLLIPAWWDRSEAAWWGIKMEPVDREYLTQHPPDRVWDDLPRPTGGRWIERRFRLFDSYPVEMNGWSHRRYYEWKRPEGLFAFCVDVQDSPDERATR